VSVVSGWNIGASPYGKVTQRRHVTPTCLGEILFVYRVRATMRSNILQFVSQTLAGRRQGFTREILTLQDRVDELVADHARMVHAQHSCANPIREALCKHLTRLDALAWQQREEDKALRTVTNGLDVETEEKALHFPR
jgi:hypothetical protein